MELTKKELEDIIVTEAEAAVLSGLNWPSAWPIAARLAAHAIFERLLDGVAYEESGTIKNTNSPWGTSVRSEVYPAGHRLAWVHARFALDGQQVIVTVRRAECNESTNERQKRGKGGPP